MKTFYPFYIKCPLCMLPAKHSERSSGDLNPVRRGRYPMNINSNGKYAKLGLELKEQAVHYLGTFRLRNGVRLLQRQDWRQVRKDA